MEIHIENFKSIEKLSLKLKNINFLVGPPASGKSNLLEAIAFYSILRKVAEYKSGIITFKGYYRNVNDLITSYFNYWRLKIDDLNSIFFERNTDIPIKIEIVGKDQEDYLKFYVEEAKEEKEKEIYKIEYKNLGTYELKEKEIDLGKTIPENVIQNSFVVRFYRGYHYPIPKETSFFVSDRYLIEFGSNLSELIEKYANDKAFKKSGINELLNKLGIILAGDKFFEKNSSIALPFEYLSDGIKQLLYTWLAISTNIKYPSQLPKLILLEEPENRIYPYYLESLAKLVLISFEEESRFQNNFIIISTHNEFFIFYLLQSIKEILGERSEEYLKNRIQIVKLDKKEYKTQIESQKDGYEAYESLLNTGSIF